MTVAPCLTLACVLPLLLILVPLTACPCSLVIILHCYRIPNFFSSFIIDIISFSLSLSLCCSKSSLHLFYILYFMSRSRHKSVGKRSTKASFLFLITPFYLFYIYTSTKYICHKDPYRNAFIITVRGCSARAAGYRQANRLVPLLILHVSRPP